MFHKQKLALLLNYIGEAYNVYDNLLTPATKKTFKSALQLPDNNFNDGIFQVHQIKQCQVETIHQSYIRLKEHASKCGFENKLKHEIKQQIILPTNNNKPRRYVFKNPALSLKDLLTYGKSLWQVAKGNRQQNKADGKKNSIIIRN